MSDLHIFRHNWFEKIEILKSQKETTKKNRNKSNKNIDKLWDLFDSDFKEDNQIECVYKIPAWLFSLFIHEEIWYQTTHSFVVE